MWTGFAFGENDEGEFEMTTKEVPIPEAAKAAGMTTLVFEDDFDSMDTIDIDATHQPGYKWYPDAYGHRLTRDYIYQKDSYIHIGGPQPSSYGLATYSNPLDAGFTVTCGCYMEARIRAGMPTGKYGGIPAFWTFKLADFKGERGWSEGGELDVVELFITKNKDGKDQKYFCGTLHHHYRQWTEDGKQERAYASNLVNNCGYRDQFPFVDDDWHTYAALWQKGHMAWYLDGQLMHSARYSPDALPEYYYRDDPTPLPRVHEVYPHVTKPERIGSHSIFDTDEGVVLLTSRETYPMDVDWVRIWR